MLSSKQQQTIQTIDSKIFELFAQEFTGHDYYHTKRVVNLTTRLMHYDDEELFAALVIAYFHDVFDDKINPSDDMSSDLLKLFGEWNLDLEGKESLIMDGIKQIGYRGGYGIKNKTFPAQYVSDADLLDAMGAVGIARTFYYAGSKKHPFHDPKLEGIAPENIEEYRNLERNPINHFNEKLLLLREWILTPEGIKIAETRHQLLVDFYNEFMEEMKDNL